MKCMVTGASGFVGPYLVEHLRSCGDEVVPVDQSNGPDLRDHDGWRNLISSERPEVVFHLAGWSDVGGSWSNPMMTYQVNTLGTVALLEAARTVDRIRVVLASSADVYGLVRSSQLPITETDSANPRSPYGASKLAAETAARAYWEGFGVETVIARPFNHLGPGQSDRFIAPALALQIAELETVGGGEVMHGDLSPKRDFTDVRDVVRAYRMLAIDGSPGELYNICSGDAVAISAVFDLLAHAATAPVEGRVDDSRIRPVDLPVLEGSFAKLQAATGWTPTLDLAASLHDVLADARKRTTSAPAE